jgi:hypothetical protein
VKRVIVVGPGAAGKTTLAASLVEITGLPVIELDKLLWQPGLVATPPGEWAAIQRTLTAQETWIMDGDLGPYDVISVRLRAADTVVFLDFAPLRCAWRGRPPVTGARRLLEVAADLPPPQPPAASAGDCRPRRSPGRLCPPDSASGEAIRHGDSVRRA